MYRQVGYISKQKAHRCFMARALGHEIPRCESALCAVVQ